MNLFELFVKIGVDDQASDKVSSLANKLGNGLKTAAKIGTAAVGAAATGIAALTTAAVNNYAEYEQLVGGVETLFGAGGKSLEEYAKSVGKSVDEAKAEYDKLLKSQQTVVDNASDAFRTAGLSANEYMETVTSFSASLLQSLGGDTAAAAEKADLAITDMADNANKMGTSMEMIQNAYQGFAKQNYTMLDNLKLGYGGTKEEMQRLLDKANKLNARQGIITDYQIDSYADIVDAIHVVQAEMGITGTTAKEAGTTIQGSVASMKSAWTNLLTGLSDGNADIEQLVGNLVTTIVGDGTETNLGVLGNILPAVETALNGASTLISKALPKIMEIIPEIINENLPILAKAAVGIIQSLMDGISQNQEMLFETIFGVITYLAESFITMLPQIVELGLNLIVSLANGISENLPEIIPTTIEIINQIMSTITENLPLLITSALEIIESLANGIAKSIPELIPAIVDVIIQIVETLIDNVDMLVDAAIEIMFALADGLINALPKLIEKVPVIITKLIDAYVENAPQMIEASLEIIVALAEGLIKSIPQLIKSIPQIVTAIVNGFGTYMSKIKDIGKNIVKGVWEGISAMASWIKDKVTDFFSGIVSGVKDFLGIHSPSRVFAGIGENMALGLGEGWENEFGSIKKGIENGMDFGVANIDVGASMLGRNSSAINSAFSNFAANLEQNATIVVQSVLDGKVIGETAYQYSRNKAKAYGV